MLSRDFIFDKILTEFYIQKAIFFLLQIPNLNSKMNPLGESETKTLNERKMKSPNKMEQYSVGPPAIIEKRLSIKRNNVTTTMSKVLIEKRDYKSIHKNVSFFYV